MTDKLSSQDREWLDLCERIDNFLVAQQVENGMLWRALSSVFANVIASSNLQGSFDDVNFDRVQVEAYRRITDASFSIVDFIEKGAPWTAQSSLMREREAEQGRYEVATVPTGGNGSVH